MLWFFLLLSGSLFAQEVVTEYQDPPFPNSCECATYRESRKYAVEISRGIDFPALSQVVYLDNGDILINSLTEDHLPYRATPQLATVIYRQNLDGSQVRYPFKSKSKQQQNFMFFRMSVSPKNNLAVSVANKSFYSSGSAVTDHRVVLVTDLVTNVTTEVFTQQLLDGTNQAVNAVVSDDGQVMVFFEDGKRTLIKQGVKTELASISLENNNWKDFNKFSVINGQMVLSTNTGASLTLDASGNKKLEEVAKPIVKEQSHFNFTGVKATNISYVEGNMTFQTEVKKLTFLELGQVIGEVELNGCRLKSVEELSPRKARVTCEEGIIWFNLDINSPLSEMESKIVGFFPCKN